MIHAIRRMARALSRRACSNPALPPAARRPRPLAAGCAARCMARALGQRVSAGPGALAVTLALALAPAPGTALAATLNVEVAGQLDARAFGAGAAEDFLLRLAIDDDRPGAEIDGNITATEIRFLDIVATPALEGQVLGPPDAPRVSASDPALAFGPASPGPFAGYALEGLFFLPDGNGGTADSVAGRLVLDFIDIGLSRLRLDQQVTLAITLADPVAPAASFGALAPVTAAATPVPLPASGVLLAGAAMLLGLTRLRRGGARRSSARSPARSDRPPHRAPA
ncbi:MAG: hypothetical protein AAFV86_05755 [Pseudomonadota bacterium]